MFYIKNIKFINIRGFRKLTLSLLDETRPRKKTLIIGRNSTCKTTLLRCIAIGLCDPYDANALIAEPIGRIVGNVSNKALIEIELVDHNIKNPIIITTNIVFDNKKGKDYVDIPASTSIPIPDNLFICGYGVSRANADQTPQVRPYRAADSVYTLFRYGEPLFDTELTIRRLRDFIGIRKYESALKEMKKALGLTSKDKILIQRGGGIEFSGPTIGKGIPLEGLADGYRLPFAMIIDIYAWAMRANKLTDKGGVEGILLIDEIEQHLHPSLQSDVLLRLNKLFPDLQIIATTHSPLVALGVEPDELVVIRKKDRYIIREDKVPDFRGYSAEDMLEDKNIFDSIIYSPLKSKKIATYNKLAANSKPSKEDKLKLKNLSKELESFESHDDKESTLLRELKKLQKKCDLQSS